MSKKISRMADYKASVMPGEILESDGTPEGIMGAIEGVFAHEGARSFNPDRPYNGQPHTHQGERGKQLISGVTMRDVTDCIALGFLLASGSTYSTADNGTATHGDLYKIDLNEIDIQAAIQNATCEIEKRMGIYPNVPGFSDDP